MRHESHRIYGTNLCHKHLPEMKKICGLSQNPVFSPILGDFYEGMATTILLMEKLMSIPVSTSQAVVGAVIGAGLVTGPKNVNFGVFKRIAIAWVSSPTGAGLLTYLVGLATKAYFA